MAGERAVSLGKGKDFCFSGESAVQEGGLLDHTFLSSVAAFSLQLGRYGVFFSASCLSYKDFLILGGLTAGLGSGRKVKLRPRPHEVGEDPYDAFQKQRITRQLAGCNCWLLCILFPGFSLGFGLRSSSGKLLGGYGGLLTLIQSWPQPRRGSWVPAEG